MESEASKHEPSPSPEPELDEASITSSLARLQEMQVALRGLRETIPKVMDSVLVDPAAPEQLHANFVEVARSAASDIKNFALIMEDGRSKDALARARKSKGRNGDGITSWLVTEHEDWLDVKETSSGEDLDTTARDAGMAPIAGEMNVGALRSLVERFKESHPGIEASVEEGSNVIKIYLPPPAHIHFDVQPEVTDGSQGGYNVGSKEKTKLHMTILDAIAARQRPNDLDSLLEMLASYMDIKSRPCVKCVRLLDRNAQFPVQRSKKRAKQADGQYIDLWDAFHTACTWNHPAV